MNAPATSLVFVSCAGDSVVIDSARWSVAGDALFERHARAHRPTFAPFTGQRPTHTVDDDGALARVAPHLTLAPAPVDDAAPESGEVVVEGEEIASVEPTIAARDVADAAAIEKARDQKLATDRAMANGSRGFDVIGEARSLADVALAEKSGFAMKSTVFRRGMLLRADGVETARASRAEYDAMASVESLCDELRSRVEGEARRDVTCGGRDVEPREDGSIDVAGETIRLTAASFASLVTRIGAPSAGAYLVACPPALRALNLAHWLDQTGEKITLRTREGRDGTREAYAVVSERYAAVDADQIANIVRSAIEPSARGTLVYDGTRTTIEGLYQTTVRPEEYVAGEVFRAGVKITSDDTGGGSMRVSACVYQNLCLNLIIIDRSEKPIMLARHIGQPRRMMRELQSAVGEAMALVAPFAAQWSTAAKADSLASTREVARVVEGRSIEGDRLMAGIFTALLAGDARRDPLPVPGRAAVARDRMLRAWANDTSGARGNTRAAIANAITRIAHTSPDVTDERRLDLEKAAGRLIWAKGPLPYAAPVD